MARRAIPATMVAGWPEPVRDVRGRHEPANRANRHEGSRDVPGGRRARHRYRGGHFRFRFRRHPTPKARVFCVSLGPR